MLTVAVSLAKPHMNPALRKNVQKVKCIENTQKESHCVPYCANA